MTRPGRMRWAVGGLLLSIVLLTAGMLLRGTGTPAVEPDAGHRVVLIGVRSLSWQTVVGLMRDREVPTLSRLARGESAKGDLISTGYGSDAEILASVATGRLPFKHGVHDADGLPMLRRTVWDWIAVHRGRVATIGFPFGPARSGDPDAVPDALLSMASPGEDLDPALRTALRRSLAGDLTTAALAEEILRSEPDRHLFIYMDGLHQWGRDSGAAGEDLRGYHRVIDTILQRWVEAGGDRTTWVLFSERGNADGPIAYRPRFPRLDRWPPIGFFMAWGDGVKASVEPHDVAPVDLAATLAYLSGNPVSIDMDGQVLFELLDDGHYFRQRLAFR